jgi:hypothetical protein
VVTRVRLLPLLLPLLFGRGWMVSWPSMLAVRFFGSLVEEGTKKSTERKEEMSECNGFQAITTFVSSLFI